SAAGAATAAIVMPATSCNLQEAWCATWPACLAHSLGSSRKPLRTILTTCPHSSHFRWSFAMQDKPASNDGSQVVKSDAEWRRDLTPDQYRVTRQHGTERAFTHPYYGEKKEGMYHCVCCGEPLFASADKYDSGTGWPSYSRPAA